MKRLLEILLVLGVMGCGSKEDIPTAPTDVSTVAKDAAVAAVKKHMTQEQLELGDPFVNSIGMVLVPIPAGDFLMEGELGGDENLHLVTITKPFHLGAYEVTQEQYQKVMGENPSNSNFKGPNSPVDSVTWHDAVEFCRRLSDRPEEKAAGHVYRLPTEAEWEYGCRTYTRKAYTFGDDENQLDQYAWFDENSGETTHPVGEKKPNPWGLYDMYGNVREWCQDWYGDYPSESQTDPTGPTTGSYGSYRVVRGGSWNGYARSCQSGNRGWNDPSDRNNSMGFRVARGPSPSK